MVVAPYEKLLPAGFRLLLDGVPQFKNFSESQLSEIQGLVCSRSPETSVPGLLRPCAAPGTLPKLVLIRMVGQL